MIDHSLPELVGDPSAASDATDARSTHDAPDARPRCIDPLQIVDALPRLGPVLWLERRAQAAARIMMRQRSGKILNVGSLGSAIGLAESSVYCGSKCGVVGVTRTMAIELAKYNVQVNAIGPGYFRTPMTEPFFQDPAHRKWIEERIPAGRVGTSDDLLGTVIFLCSPASDYLTGQIVYVDGGWLAS